ncbi:MAG TPA: DUF192 domain-containing protein [Candidatus Saccharimonadales bacterium]|nr:DUF192 domain-containing protein [Candidatus Saccharimonadales bacterium]
MWARSWLALAGLALVIATATALAFLPPSQDQPTIQAELPSNTLALRFGRSTYNVWQARTLAQKEQGLSGVPAMTKNQGMLFDFADGGQKCFWMKDMRFALDIVWLDNTKHVVAIEHRLTPATYPAVFCHNGQYVLELNAGQTVASSLTPTTTARF